LFGGRIRFWAVEVAVEVEVEVEVESRWRLG
jgi:hypothetical protein